jgi:hypothetical protein
MVTAAECLRAGQNEQLFLLVLHGHGLQPFRLLFCSVPQQKKSSGSKNIRGVAELHLVQFAINRRTL